MSKKFHNNIVIDVILCEELVYWLLLVIEKKAKESKVDEELYRHMMTLSHRDWAVTVMAFVNKLHSL